VTRSRCYVSRGMQEGRECAGHVHCLEHTATQDDILMDLWQVSFCRTVVVTSVASCDCTCFCGVVLAAAEMIAHDNKSLVYSLL